MSDIQKQQENEDINDQSFLDYLNFLHKDPSGQLVYEFEQDLTFFDFTSMMGSLRARTLQQDSTLTTYIMQNGVLEFLLPWKFQGQLPTIEGVNQQQIQTQVEKSSKEQNFIKIVQYIKSHISHIETLRQKSSKQELKILSGKFIALWNSTTYEINPKELNLDNEQLEGALNGSQVIYITYHELVGVVNTQAIKTSQGVITQTVQYNHTTKESKDNKSKAKKKKGKGEKNNEKE